MGDVGNAAQGSADLASAQATEILNPTLQDNDFLLSFVRVGLEESVERGGNRRGKYSRRDGKAAVPTGSSLTSHQTIDTLSELKDEGTSERRKDKKRRRRGKGASALDKEMTAQKSKKKKRRKNCGLRRQEEVYTDKDRAAAVNMGSRDIKQSLKMKRRQDRSRALQIPEEAEPGAMLALAAYEMRSGDVEIAINFINKVSGDSLLFRVPEDVTRHSIHNEYTQM